MQRQGRSAGGIGGGRSGLQLQPVVMVTEALTTGVADLAAAAGASPASGKGAAASSSPSSSRSPSPLLGVWSLRSGRIFSPVIAARG